MVLRLAVDDDPDFVILHKNRRTLGGGGASIPQLNGGLYHVLRIGRTGVTDLHMRRLEFQLLSQAVQIESLRLFALDYEEESLAVALPIRCRALEVAVIVTRAALHGLAVSRSGMKGMPP